MTPSTPCSRSSASDLAIARRVARHSGDGHQRSSSTTPIDDVVPHKMASHNGPDPCLASHCSRTWACINSIASRTEA